jgi:hypothetical protein
VSLTAEEFRFFAIAEVEIPMSNSLFYNRSSVRLAAMHASRSIRKYGLAAAVRYAKLQGLV